MIECDWCRDPAERFYRYWVSNTNYTFYVAICNDCFKPVDRTFRDRNIPLHLISPTEYRMEKLKEAL